MASSHRNVKRRDSQLEKLYSRYTPIQTKSDAPSSGRAQSAAASDIQVLSDSESRFVRRDLARVIVAASVTLIVIISVWATADQPYWQNFVVWLSETTNF